MFNLLAHTKNFDGMVTATEAKTLLAALVLIIIAQLVIIIYLANTWQPKSFTAKKAAAKKTVAKKTTKK